jgi:hydrogenase/urease accessory protein HupE
VRRVLQAAGKSLCLSVALLLLLLHVSTLWAHDARPVAVTLNELWPGIYNFSLRVPPSVEAGNQPLVEWPANCMPLSNGQGGTAGATVQCPGDLEGQQFALHYPLFNPSLATFYRLNRLQGGSITAMLAPTDGKWTVPPAVTPGRVVKEYTLLGIEHIITGYDHLLFVFGLLVIARSTRRILLTVTGFTLAHSISLSLSALGFVHVPVPPVEATIALSIVFLAHEIGQQNTGSLTYRYPLLVAFSFGLLHGLGFASALGEIGLAQNEALLSLLFFNVGVEIGQLLFIGTVLGLLWLASKLLKLAPKWWESGALRSRGDLCAAYVIGIPSVYWLIDRVAQFV